MQEALEEQESLKVQIAEYARQVARVEELLTQKVSSLAYVALQKQLFVCIGFPLLANQSRHAVSSTNLEQTNISCSWLLHVFLRLAPVTCFPTFGIGYQFPRVWRWFYLSPAFSAGYMFFRV